MIPTEPGYYWAKAKVSFGNLVMLRVVIMPESGELQVEKFGVAGTFPLDQFVEYEQVTKTKESS